MEQSNKDIRNLSTTVWVLIILCVAIIIAAICGGVAYRSIQQAQLSAAQASIGHIEAVLYLAERQAQDEGLGPPPAAYPHLMKSYSAAGEDYTEYERFILGAMLDSFGPARNFDFAVTRYEDPGGIHTQVFFFPTKGLTNQKTDRFYLMEDGTVTANNA